MQYSRCSLTSAEPRGRIRSFDPLATLLLMQPKITLAAFTIRAHYQLNYCSVLFALRNTIIHSFWIS